MNHEEILNQFIEWDKKGVHIEIKFVWYDKKYWFWIGDDDDCINYSEIHYETRLEAMEASLRHLNAIKQKEIFLNKFNRVT